MATSVLKQKVKWYSGTTFQYPWEVGKDDDFKSKKGKQILEILDGMRIHHPVLWAYFCWEWIPSDDYLWWIVKIFTAFDEYMLNKRLSTELVTSYIRRYINEYHWDSYSTSTRTLTIFKALMKRCFGIAIPKIPLEAIKNDNVGKSAIPISTINAFL